MKQVAFSACRVLLCGSRGSLMPALVLIELKCPWRAVGCHAAGHILRPWSELSGFVPYSYLATEGLFLLSAAASGGLPPLL